MTIPGDPSDEQIFVGSYRESGSNGGSGALRLSALLYHWPCAESIMYPQSAGLLTPRCLIWHIDGFVSLRCCSQVGSPIDGTCKVVSPEWENSNSGVRFTYASE